MKKSLLCNAALLATMAASASVAASTGIDVQTNGRMEELTAPPPSAPLKVASIEDKYSETTTLAGRRDTGGGPPAVAGKAS